QDGDRAAPDRHEARAVRLHRRDRDRRGDAARLLRAPAFHQRPPVAHARPPERPSMIPPKKAVAPRRRRASTVGEPAAVRFALIALALAFLGLFVVLPIGSVFAQAFAKGPGAYLSAILDPEALSAIKLTLLTAAISVPLNVSF